MTSFKFGQTRGSALVLCLVLAGPLWAEDRTFSAEGADAAFGLGPRYLAMGGTGAATADDVYALYYNPANLGGIDRPMVTLGRQVEAVLRPYSFAGVALPLPFTQAYGFDATLALARYPRIHAHSTGAFGPDDFESVFLRFLLPGLTGDYDGTIDSKTMVNRLALGVTLHDLPWLSLGGNVDMIDCRTGTCGVSAGTVYSVHATAVSYGLSVALRPSDTVTLGLAVSDVSTGLTITSVTTDASGSTTSILQSQLPWRVGIEAAWQARSDLLLAVGTQSYRGHYGGYDLVIDTLHAGAEWQAGGPWAVRAGAWAPLRIESGQFVTPQVIAKAAPTLGLGWKKAGVAADLAILVHPLDSMHAGRPVVSEEFSLTIQF